MQESITVSRQLVQRNEKGQLLKGSVLNPTGEKGRQFQTLFREAVKRIAEGNEEADDILIVRKVIDEAKKGNLKAVEIVLDRTDGKVPTPISNDDGEPFQVIISKYEANTHTIPVQSTTIPIEPTGISTEI